ncbi:MAG: hypothetical protein RI911_2 [Candidatus Parcubacteria bacterium]|jgi:aspartate kinase
MIVMKFGGTSVGNAQSITSAAQIIAAHKSKDPIVVVSAVAGVTDLLINLFEQTSQQSKKTSLAQIENKHKTILSDLGLDGDLLDVLFNDLSQITFRSRDGKTAKSKDAVVSFGERFSSRIVAAVLQRNHKIAASAVDAWDIGMLTTGSHGNSEPLTETPNRIRNYYKKRRPLTVVTGFIGKTKDGEITTLGRGGSDYTTAIIGGAIQADEIQIWKEVDGVLTTDPRIFPSAKLVTQLHYEEAGELAYFGAKVLHPKTMLPAMQKNVPIRVLNTFRPKGKGTLISSTIANNLKGVPKAITSKKGTTVITVHSPDFFDGSGLIAKIFKLFEVRNIPVDVVATSVVNFSCSFGSQYYTTSLKKELERIGPVDVQTDCAIICIVGAHMNTAKVIGDSCSAFLKAKIPVKMVSESASGNSVTFLVEEILAQKSIITLHKALL